MCAKRRAGRRLATAPREHQSVGCNPDYSVLVYPRTAHVHFWSGCQSNWFPFPGRQISSLSNCTRELISSVALDTSPETGTDSVCRCHGKSCVFLRLAVRGSRSTAFCCFGRGLVNKNAFPFAKEIAMCAENRTIRLVHSDV